MYVCKEQKFKQGDICQMLRLPDIGQNRSGVIKLFETPLHGVSIQGQFAMVPTTKLQSE